MLKTSIFGFVVAFCGLVIETGAESNSRNFEDQKRALAIARAKIENLKSNPSSNIISEVGEVMWKTTRPSIYQVEERQEVHNLAKEALIATPEHAKYFRDRIEGSRSKMKATLAEGGVRTSYDSERVHCFEILKLLPSPNAVDVLGTYLDDDSDEPPPPKTVDDAFAEPANSRLAASALGELIETPPVQRDPRSYRKEDVETWKLWYAQVKAGTREFKFKGDDRVYRLSGSKVEDHVEPLPPHALPSDATPTGPPSDKKAYDAGAKPHSGALPLILSFAVLGVAVAWMLISKRLTKA